MRFVSYRRGNGGNGFGTVKGDAIVDLSERLGSQVRSLKAALAQGVLQEAQAIGEAGETGPGLGEVELLPPIPVPEKIICIGVNYGDRNAEYRDASAQPKLPSVFLRTPDSLVGHGSPILRPPESEQLDYEGEIAIIIGKGGRRIKEADAAGHIAGLTIMNEGSVRDWMRHGKFNVTQGKNFARSGAAGPWMVSADEIADFDDMTVTTRVNGDERQHDTTANLMFPFRYLIAYLSTFMILKPGDVIATGTPSGAGARFEPPKFLVPGDVVTVEVPGIGILQNTVEDEVTD